MRYGRRPVLKRSITMPDCGLITTTESWIQVGGVEQAAVGRERDIADEIAARCACASRHDREGARGRQRAVGEA